MTQSTPNLFKQSTPVENTPKTTKDKILEREKGIAKLCSKLLTPSADFDCTDWIEELTSYSNNFDRIIYTPVSDFIFKLDEISRDLFLTNLDAVLEAQSYKDVPEKITGVVIKFWDHANLAGRQIQMFNQTQRDLQERVKNEISHSVVQIEKEMIAQFIGLVAIFTALSFIVFGGINGLEVAFTEAKQSILSLCISGLIWSFCMMNLLFLFIHLILKILQRGNPETTPTHDKWPKEAVFCNFILLSGLTVFGWAFYVCEHGIGKFFYNWIIEHNTGFFVFITVILFVGIIALGYFIKSSVTCKKD